MGYLRRPVLPLAAVMGAVVLASPAGGSHGPNRWAGKWNTSTGSLSLLVMSSQEVEAAKTAADSGQLWDKLPCKAGPRFYRGAYSTGQGDRGKVLGCGTSTRLRARFLSTGRFRGAAGSFTIKNSESREAPLTFTGSYREDSGGSGRYTGTWTGHLPGDGCCQPSVYEGPFEASIRFHAQNLPTKPPADGGRCPEPTVRAIVTGTIIGRRTKDGDIQGGGNVAATPHLNRCRVPVINVRIDDVELRVLNPGRRLRLQMAVRISGSGVHRPGDCRVGTTGTIVAIYDNTVTVANGLRDHRLTIGPWRAPGCTAHENVITNFITSIPADAGSSTWVRVSIACPGPGLSPRNCE